METKTNTRNELFKRNEMSFELESEKNPIFDEMRKQISEETKKPEENINVYNIKGNFGSNQFKINAYVYDSKGDLEKAEQKTQKQRKAEVEDAKKVAEDKSKAEEASVEEKPVEEKKEEAPAEEIKDETPVEDKLEEEKKEVKEERQAEEESKEN